MSETPTQRIVQAPTKTRKTYVLYHGGGCPDGFTSAWIAHKVFGSTAVYTALQFNEPMPSMEDDSDVFILDFAIRFAFQDVEETQALDQQLLSQYKRNAVVPGQAPDDRRATGTAAARPRGSCRPRRAAAA